MDTAGGPATTRGDGGIEIAAMTHRFGELTVIDGLRMSCAAGEVVGLVGPSGCGKSTLLNLIAGLADPGAGSIAVAGASDPGERLARCAHMPQRDLLLPWLSALDNAALALRNRGLGRKRARKQAAMLFERFGLGGFEPALPRELSGGMRQRVAFIRTLVAGKPVLLLDEPFAALDSISRADMQRWLAAAIRDERRTAVLVTHDVEEALYLADRVAILSPRPAQVTGWLTPPRPRDPDRAGALADPHFVAMRREATAQLTPPGDVGDRGGPAPGGNGRGVAAADGGTA